MFVETARSIFVRRDTAQKQSLSPMRQKLTFPLTNGGINIMTADNKTKDLHAPKKSVNTSLAKIQLTSNTNSKKN